MRTVCFSNARLQRQLRDSFYCTVTNIEGDPSAGVSLKHAPSDEPGPNVRGVGRQNVQTIFTTPEGGIFHVATGYLPPNDLLKEAAFALSLFERIEKSPEKARMLVQSTHRKRANRAKNGRPKSRIPFLRFPSPLQQDSQFFAENPLLARCELERNPRLLVGQGHTAYGSGKVSGGSQPIRLQTSDAVTTQSGAGKANSKRVVIPGKGKPRKSVR